MPKAVVLLSGGLDSTTTAAQAKRDGYEIVALTVQYGQRHQRELDSARNVAKALEIAEHIVLDVDLGAFGASALTDEAIEVPTGRQGSEMTDIPATYVPARNTVLLSLALACAEARGAERIYIGANAVDYSGYPDCRPEFINAFQKVAKLGTKQGVEGKPTKVVAPLISMTKAEIIQHAIELGAPIDRTWSCYQGGDAPCRTCDSCVLRAKGFTEAGLRDPALA